MRPFRISFAKLYQFSHKNLPVFGKNFATHSVPADFATLFLPYSTFCEVSVGEFWPFFVILFFFWETSLPNLRLSNQSKACLKRISCLAHALCMNEYFSNFMHERLLFYAWTTTSQFKWQFKKQFKKQSTDQLLVIFPALLATP